jgi:hypothetical protein
MTIGTRFRQLITRSASLLDSRRQNSPYRFDQGIAYEASTISFTASDTIGDSGNGLANFLVGDDISIVGSNLNSRKFKVVTSAAGTLTVEPAIVQAEIAGNKVMIRTA